MLREIAIEQLNLSAPGKKEDEFIREVITDYWICCVSREASILGRKEVLGGKAKFGIVGDGKEVPQVALARSFQKGDWRSGYYRDQTWMFAAGISSVEDFFAQLYADTKNDPFSGGRQMNCHFATPIIDKDGLWLSQDDRYNISADISSTGGQMARAVGIAQASSWYRAHPDLGRQMQMSNHGNEVCFVTIGDASTSEGVFWEAINAAAVIKAPMAVSVWDDGFGISVPIALQTTKQSISRLLEGFHIDENGEGIYLYTAKAWDYPGLCEMYERGIQKVRKNHIPAVFHIQEVTQPTGHSTSGSHERYKSAERLKWENDNDCILRMGEWMVESGITNQKALDEIRQHAIQYTRECKQRAWNAFIEPVREKREELKSIFNSLPDEVKHAEPLSHIAGELNSGLDILFSEVLALASKLKFELSASFDLQVDTLENLISSWKAEGSRDFNTHLYAQGKGSALEVPIVQAHYSESAEMITGFQVLNRFFDQLLARDNRVVAFGEDVGKIGDVNQGFAGLQDKYGVERVWDTGIREWTIMGQAIGLALRGLRPIAEIQYLDYLIYGLTALSDDLASLRYRTNGIQTAPAIIRTRGHRLEGIWHAGSPMGMLLSTLRGIHICVPRNMTQAAGMYNTLMQSNEPGLVIECLNGYRLKEKCPDNLDVFTVPLGMPEILQAGNDITLVTYGSCVRVAQEAVQILANYGISVELIDVQTLLPFDLEHVISHSLKKTNRILFLDEDIPGGATAYMMREVMDNQNGYFFLDEKPRCLTAKAHRPAYGSDGDYFSKPNVAEIVETVLEIVHRP
ncbi:MAG TPA: thiamine pyrophosphate-dependent enzyme [Saprospiraceae bacterium]|nr:thiamine pyrophosphate-dependent enzyme [Saprospiraceae bacterium]